MGAGIRTLVGISALIFLFSLTLFYGDLCRLDVFLHGIYYSSRSGSESSGPIAISGQQIHASVVSLVDSTKETDTPTVQDEILASSTIDESIQREGQGDSTWTY